MPITVTAENKLVIRNEHATIVITNGTPVHVEVRRPGDEHKNSDFKDTRDIKFASLYKLEQFLIDAVEAYVRAAEELNITSKLTIVRQTK